MTDAADGTRIYYREPGAAVVLLHGGVIDAAGVSWTPVIDWLEPDSITPSTWIRLAR